MNDFCGNHSFSGEYFIVRTGVWNTQAYQVTVTLSVFQTRDRKLAGLLEAMTVYLLTEGYILTMKEKKYICMQ